MSGEGFVDGQGATYSVTGSQTEVGSSANSFTYTLADGTLAGNYVISVVPGTLTVTEATAPVTPETPETPATPAAPAVPKTADETTDVAPVAAAGLFATMLGAVGLFFSKLRRRNEE